MSLQGVFACTCIPYHPSRDLHCHRASHCLQSDRFCLLFITASREAYNALLDVPF